MLKTIPQGVNLNYAMQLFTVAPTPYTSEKINSTLTEETNLGKVKTEQIKHLGKELMTRFPSKFNTNFDDNKRMVDEVTKGTTTRVRNKVAGYITRTNALAQASSAMESEIEEDELAE